MPPFSDLVDLNGLVALGRHQELAGVVVVETEDVRLRAAIFRFVALEELLKGSAAGLGRATNKRHVTLVGLKFATMSGTAEVLGRLLASVRVMWRDVEGVPFAGDAESAWSRSIGVDAIVGRIRRCLLKELVAGRDCFTDNYSFLTGREFGLIKAPIVG